MPNCSDGCVKAFTGFWLLLLVVVVLLLLLLESSDSILACVRYSNECFLAVVLNKMQGKDVSKEPQLRTSFQNLT